MRTSSRELIPVFFITVLFFMAVTPLVAHAGPNLIANPSVEEAFGDAPAGWAVVHRAANTTVFTYPTAGYESTKAVSAQVSAYTAGSEGWYFNPISISPNIGSDTTSIIRVVWY